MGGPPLSRDKEGAATGPSPVGRRESGKHHLICDGAPRCTSSFTAANVNDITQTLALVDGIRRWPDAPDVAADPPSRAGQQAYDSRTVRRELHHRQILLKDSLAVEGLGRLRYVVGHTLLKMARS